MTVDCAIAAVHSMGDMLADIRQCKVGAPQVPCTHTYLLLLLLLQ